MGWPARAARASCWRACGGSRRARVRGKGTVADAGGRILMPGTPEDQGCCDTLDLRSPGFISCAYPCHLLPRFEPGPGLYAFGSAGLLASVNTRNQMGTT